MLISRLLIITIINLTAIGCLDKPQCVSRDYGLGSTVCVCNSTHCDTLPNPEKVKKGQYLIYTTNQKGLRFHKQIKNFTHQDTLKNRILLTRGTKYQKIVGWGAAFSDSSGINIKSMSSNLQEKILESYFSESGIGYNLCRVPIGGTDFSNRVYTYSDGDPDVKLSNFTLAEEDYLYKIPYIKKALKLNKELLIFGSAWTAPKWMKTNNAYDGVGFLKQEYYQTWADYMLKFLDTYEAKGVRFWGITTGNEPDTAFFGQASKRLNLLTWWPRPFAKWITNHFGPTIRNSTHSNITILGLNDQRILVPWYFSLMVLFDRKVIDYVDAIAVQWYANMFTPAFVLTLNHWLFPDKFILSTEACFMHYADNAAVKLGLWDRGEEYSSDIIKSLNNWVTGWLEWNLALDEGGGPSVTKNYVDAPIIVNVTSQEFYKQPMFYHLGHFFKFITRNSIRINLKYPDDLMAVAFERTDNATAIVILNKKDNTIAVSIIDDVRGSANLELSPKSITTLLYW